MLKRPVTYKNFNDEQVTKTFYFNLSKAEIIEIEFQDKISFADRIKAIIANTEDNHKLVAEFKAIILMAYGEKSADGESFDKSDEIREKFSKTAAFQELFIDLLNAEKAAEFINGILPKETIDEVKSSTPTPFQMPVNLHPQDPANVAAMGVPRAPLLPPHVG